MKKSRPDSSSRWLSMWAWVGISALGCSGGSEDSGTASLPPDSGTGSDNRDTGPGFFDVDTGPSGDTGLNESPPYDLRIEHTGAWERLPLGGPYTDLIGTMSVHEYLLGDATICNAEFSLTGIVSETKCDHCAEAFDILFYMVSQGELDAYDEQVLDDNGDPVAGIERCQFPEP